MPCSPDAFRLAPLLSRRCTAHHVTLLLEMQGRTFKVESHSTSKADQIHAKHLTALCQPMWAA